MVGLTPYTPAKDLTVNPRSFIKQKVQTATNELKGLPVKQTSMTKGSGIPMKPQVAPKPISSVEIAEPGLANVSAQLPQVSREQVMQTKSDSELSQGGWEEVANPFEGADFNPEDYLEEVDPSGSLDGWVETTDPFANESSAEGATEDEQYGSGLGQQVKNAVGSAGNMATGFGEFVGDQGADLVAWVAKKLGADENKTNTVRDEFKQYLEDSKPNKTIGGDPNSLVYKVIKGVGDIAQTIAPVGAGAKIGQVVSKGGQLASKLPGALELGKVISKSPGLVRKGLKLASEGASDVIKYDAIANQEIANPKEIALGAGLGVGAGALGAGLKKGAGLLSSKLELAGLINPGDLKKAATALGDEKMAKEVGDWMLDKKFVGTKSKIIDQVDNFVDENYQATQSALQKSTSEHKVPAAEGALKELKKAFGGDDARAGLEETFDEVNTLLKKTKGKGLTLSELDRVQYLQGKYLPNFTKSMEVSDKLNAQANANLYTKVKKYIEDVATKEGIGDIKSLKKDTQIGHILRTAISKKEASDFSRNFLSPFAGAGVGGGLGALNSGVSPLEDPEKFIKNVVGGALIGGAVNSKVAQSNIANILKKLSSGEKSALAETLKALTRGGSAGLVTNGLTEKEVD